MIVEEVFLKWTAEVVGKPCWGVAAGGCAGSMFSLEFGKKIPREKAVDNSMLEEDVRLYRGEYHLLVQCSHWVLLSLADGTTKIVTDSKDDRSVTGPMVMGLESLKGLSIEAAEFDPLTRDLEIVFTGKVVLCVSGGYPKESYGYTVFFPQGYASLNEEGFEVEQS